MKPYTPRRIDFVSVISVANWQFKVYTITVNQNFQSEDVLQQAIKNLAQWINAAAKYPLPNYKVGCLIVHEGQGSIFSLVNWWVDENMLQNHVYRTTYNQPLKFEPFSAGGIQCCVWELEVMWYERNTWIKHVLRPGEPDFNAYLSSPYGKLPSVIP